jgi:hypothetical protein
LVVARRQEVDPVVLDEVDDPVLLRQPPRPRSRREMLQRLGISDPSEGVAEVLIDEVEQAGHFFRNPR